MLRKTFIVETLQRLPLLDLSKKLGIVSPNIHAGSSLGTFPSAEGFGIVSPSMLKTAQAWKRFPEPPSNERDAWHKVSEVCVETTVVVDMHRIM